MRKVLPLLALVVILAFTGCAGPENKLGRGLRNSTSLISGADISRSMEQTAVWEGPNTSRTTGFLRGFNRTMARTGIGLYEVVTFPIPPYRPLLVPEHGMYPDHSIKTTKQPWGGLRLPEGPVHPASYKPGFRDTPSMNTDATLGFSGGEMFPGIPGSRFRVFE